MGWKPNILAVVNGCDSGEKMLVGGGGSLSRRGLRSCRCLIPIDGRWAKG